jgi:hypothetical protein
MQRTGRLFYFFAFQFSLGLYKVRLKTAGSETGMKVLITKP